jgi:hypothetical protein
MASTKRFTTGGGFPNPDSPGREIEFTLSYGKSNLYQPNPTAPSYGEHLEFSDPEDPAYVCAMYGPPRDEVGLKAFTESLAKAYQDVADDPEYRGLPVPPLPYGQALGHLWRAEGEINGGSVAQACQWARQFAPGTNVSIHQLRGAGANAYRVQARDSDNRLVAEHSGFTKPVTTGPRLDESGQRSAMWKVGDPTNTGSSNEDRSATRDPRNIRILRRVVAP